MKSIAYAIVASVCLTLGCFAPQGSDRFGCALLGILVLVALMFREEGDAA